MLDVKLHENIYNVYSRNTELLERERERSLCVLLYKYANIIHSESDNFRRKEHVFCGYLDMNTEITWYSQCLFRHHGKSEGLY